MVNQTLLSLIQTEIVPHSWESVCIAALNASTSFEWDKGLVNSKGHAVAKLTNATWGISIEACKAYCNHKIVPFVFSFPSFSSSMTNYFLPWLALTAQLPFETGDFINNGMSFCLAVGSPALVTYSLCITILNRYWVRKSFDDLRTKAHSLSVRQKFSEYEGRIRASKFLLQEAQQVPLRASQERGWLSSLVVIPDNSIWWENLEARLKSTRRGVTASLVAQIPVIAGFITCGTQYSHHSIQDALEADGALRAMEPPILPGRDYSDPTEQPGLVVRPGLNPQPHRVQTVAGAFDALTSHILSYLLGLEPALEVTNSRRDQSTTTQGFLHGGNSRHRLIQPFSGPSTIRATAQFCGLDTHPILAYHEWSDIPSEIYRRVIAASVVALFLQWGTTGASILIAYLTPTIGLGCRSASYLLYGCLATASWICLLTSMLISHEVMLRYQRAHVINTSMDFRLRHDPGNSDQYSRNWARATLCAIAVMLRYIGKSLAFLNTLWLITSSLMEFTGGYDNCFCKGNYIGMGNKGWIVLFKGAEDLAAAARLPWGGGLALTLLVCFVSYTFFFFGYLKTDDD